jgi:hydrogenase maturation protease
MMNDFKHPATPPILVFGYGNPGWQDDGIGIYLIQELEKKFNPHVSLDFDFQLFIEHALDISHYEKVLFIDASLIGTAPFYVKKVEAASHISFSSHYLSPESVLALCQEHFHRTPEAWIIGVKIYKLEINEPLTVQAQENAQQALQYITLLLNEWKLFYEWKENNMEDKQKQKTILVVDDDPDIRSIVRLVLESAGFVVGEAATGEEGLKVARRINPDAILLDLMMETIDAGSNVSVELRKSGYNAPIYMLSSVGDSVRDNVHPSDLGLAGIFQKPIDPQILLTTLKTKLRTE